MLRVISNLFRIKGSHWEVIVYLHCRSAKWIGLIFASQVLTGFAFDSVGLTDFAWAPPILPKIGCPTDLDGTYKNDHQRKPNVNDLGPLPPNLIAGNDTPDSQTPVPEKLVYAPKDDGSVEVVTRTEYVLSRRIKFERTSDQESRHEMRLVLRQVGDLLVYEQQLKEGDIGIRSTIKIGTSVSGCRDGAIVLRRFSSIPGHVEAASMAYSGETEIRKLANGSLQISERSDAFMLSAFSPKPTKPYVASRTIVRVFPQVDGPK